MSKKSIILLIVSCIFALSAISVLASGSVTGFLSCLAVAAVCLFFFVKSRKQDKYDAKREERDSRNVYISDSGNKYHTDTNCCGSGWRMVTVREAKKLGKTYCKKCAELYR